MIERELKYKEIAYYNNKGKITLDLVDDNWDQWLKILATYENVIQRSQLSISSSPKGRAIDHPLGEIALKIFTTVVWLVGIYNYKLNDKRLSKAIDKVKLKSSTRSLCLLNEDPHLAPEVALLDQWIEHLLKQRR